MHACVVVFKGLGHGVMVLKFDLDTPRVFGKFNTRVPKTGWFSDKSVLFTMMDRRVKHLRRNVCVCLLGPLYYDVF